MEGIELLLGKTLIAINKNKDKEIEFIVSEDEKYIMYHSQDCCEQVYIDDIVGDLEDLIGSPITIAREDTNKDNEKEDSNSSFTWTFYNLATIKGYVTIKWYGTSNGYYSESVTVQNSKDDRWYI